MPPTRPNLTQPDLTRSHLTLDEQSFQGLLSAAFTIQEHNDQVRKAQLAPVRPEARRGPETNIVCPQCGASKATEESTCQNCNRQFRPGERLQRNWASMWLMSQQQELWPERVVDERGAAQAPHPDKHRERRTLSPLASDSASNGLLAWPSTTDTPRETTGEPETETKNVLKESWSAETVPDRVLDKSSNSNLRRSNPELDDSHEPILEEPILDKAGIGKQEAEDDWTSARSVDLGRDLAFENSDQTLELDQLPEDDASSIEADGTDATASRHSLAELRVKLRFRRADIYLGAAVIVASVALMWPTVSAPRHGTLGPMGRALVAMGLAEAPTTVIHLKGDPGINVWIDPHTALYYCPGEEQYGKTADGRFSSQHDAQLDRFEPAGRSVCE